MGIKLGTLIMTAGPTLYLKAMDTTLFSEACFLNVVISCYLCNKGVKAEACDFSNVKDLFLQPIAHMGEASRKPLVMLWGIVQDVFQKTF